MAELFENMEIMDIQAERRNTEEQRQRADSAELRADEAEQRANEAEQKAKNEKQKADTAITILIKSYQNAGTCSDAILQILVNELGMDKDEALFKIKQ